MAMCVVVKEAIESARSATLDTSLGGVRKERSFRSIRHIVLSVIRELPDDMLISELRDELEISNNQEG